MRTTLNIEEKLIHKAEELTGISEKTYLARLGLEARIQEIVSPWEKTDSKKMFGSGKMGTS